MEINLGDLGISPAMLRKFQENYATGIAAPKKAKKAAGKKKAVVKKTKPADRKRGQPVGGRGIDVKAPKPVAAIKPPKPKPNRRRTRAEIEAPEAVRFGRKGTKSARPVSKAPVVAKKPVVPKAPKPPTSGLYIDPSVRQRLKELVGSGGGIIASQEARDRQAAIEASNLYPEIQSANQALNKYVKEKHGNSENSAQSDPAYQKMVKDLFALQDQAAGGGSMPRTGQPEGPQPGTGTVPDDYNYQSMPPQPPMPDKFEGRYVPQGSILGTPDMSISSNIVGQSYDPSFAESFKQPPQPPGSTFGGYGGQAPMQALNPYAGMAQNNPQPTDFFPTYIPRPAPVYEPLPEQTTTDAQPVMNQQSQRPLLSQNPGSSRYGADGIRTYRR